MIKSMKYFSRRSFLQDTASLGLGAAAFGLPMFRSSPALAALRIKIGVGLGTETAPLVITIEKERLLEQAAKEIGTEAIEPEYLSFAALLRMLQGIAAGQLQFGNLGSTPTIRTLSNPRAAIPVAIAGGGNNFPLQVPVGSPIKNLDDLKGKTILTLVASDLHLVLLLMLKAHFGTDDVKKLGITVMNIQAHTELTIPRKGIDAVVSDEPHGRAAELAGNMVTVLRNSGETGDAYDGPEGKGAGHFVESFKTTPFYPEAYYPHRLWWVVRKPFLQEHPKAVTAFLIANARATKIMSKKSVDEVIACCAKYWYGDAEAQRPFVKRILWRRRGWGWITEGDANSLVGLSKNKKIYDTPLTKERVKEVMKLGAEVSKAAWEHVGRDPAMEVFTDPKAGDVRGLPTWEIARWSF
ncbi:MAG: ABC transporter substrate-binding protein [Alphaproteobacteria bacterium]